MLRFVKAGDNYRTLLGMLTIFLFRTRPKIAYSVNRLATRTVGATVKDMDAVYEIILYLKCTAHLELTYLSGCVARPARCHCAPLWLG